MPKYKVVASARYEYEVEAEDEDAAIWDAASKFEDNNPTRDPASLFSWQAEEIK